MIRCRGKPRLYFLTPEIFRNPALIDDREERRWVQDLLERVRTGYEIIMEIPSDWGRQVLEPSERIHFSLAAPPSGSVVFGDPFGQTPRGGVRG